MPVPSPRLAQMIGRGVVAEPMEDAVDLVFVQGASFPSISADEPQIKASEEVICVFHPSHTNGKARTTT